MSLMRYFARSRCAASGLLMVSRLVVVVQVVLFNRQGSHGEFGIHDEKHDHLGCQTLSVAPC